MIFFCYLRFQSHVFSKGIVDLLVVDILRGILVPFVLEPPSHILSWNTRLEDYVELVFNFASHFLFKRGVIIFLFIDDLHVLKEVSSFLDSYKFVIKMKWVFINSLPLVSTKERIDMSSSYSSLTLI